MDFPHGHTHHQSHHRRDDREEEYPPPPPHVRPPFDPYYNEPPPPLHARPPYDPYINEPPPPVRSAVDPYYNQPPPPQVTHVHHESSYPNYQPPPPQVAHVSHVGHESHPSYPPPNTDYYNPPPPRADPYPPPPRADPYPPPPRADPYPSGSTVQHVSHESGKNNAHHFKPHMPSFISGQTHHQGPDVVPNRKPTVRLFSKAETNYSLSIRDGKVILAPSNPSDPLQHWIKDERFSTKVKDEQGFPSFALINEATGQAMKHSIGATHPVQLIPFNPDRLDESILWTLSKDLGDGYRTIRMVNNIRLNVDAFNGDQNHGGVHDGTKIVLWEWLKGENQRWKIIPY